jgi:hypothetical protein
MWLGLRCARCMCVDLSLFILWVLLELLAGREFAPFRAFPAHFVFSPSQ